MDSIVVSIFRNKYKTNDSKIYPRTEYSLYFDGCSKGNPGQSGIGAVLYKMNAEIWAAARYLGAECTNNEAEYNALILGLEEASCQKIEKLTVFGDSLLVINQVNGVYKVKAKNLFSLHEKVEVLKKNFKSVTFQHVLRDFNKRADELSNIALNACHDVVYFKGV